MLSFKKSILKSVQVSMVATTFMYGNHVLARDNIQMVGSSTVYPFATIIAEEFGNNTEFRTPIVESTGTGGGFKLFCSGIGSKYPDFSNASRAIKESEVKKCKTNGISPIEVKIGYDGIVLANATKSPAFNLTKKQIFLALAEYVPSGGKLIKNPYQKWNDIDKSLPNKEIAVYGPPPTSGTRDAFVELVMEKACVKLPEFVSKYSNKKARKKACHIIRTDTKFIEAGENDNLIVQKLKNNPDALGIFGFSFLQQNSDVIKGLKINNIKPIFKNIVSGKYPVSRPLFIYAKKENFYLIPGMAEFIEEIVSPAAISTDGYLVERGLIPLSEKDFDKVSDNVLNNL